MQKVNLLVNVPVTVTKAGTATAEPSSIDLKGYYTIDYSMTNGFKYTLPAPGYQVLKSIKFFMDLNWSESAIPRKISKVEYDDLNSVIIEDEPPVKTKRKSKKEKWTT